LGEEKNRGYLSAKLVARSVEDHDTQSTGVIQTIDIRAAEALFGAVMLLAFCRSRDVIQSIE
jgi:hypothetical protein